MIEFSLAPESTSTAWIWWAFGTNYRDVAALDSMVRERSAESFLERTRNYWKLWVKKETLGEMALLPAAVQRLYRRSLLIIRTQIDNSGAVIAATDSDIVQFGRDTYQGEIAVPSRDHRVSQPVPRWIRSIPRYWTSIMPFDPTNR